VASRLISPIQPGWLVAWRDKAGRLQRRGRGACTCDGSQRGVRPQGVGWIISRTA